MKRRKLLQHLRSKGCRHSWWQNASQNKRSAIPRHSEINDMLVKKICKDLGVEPPESTS